MIIDVHCHLGNSPGFHFPDTSVATMLRVMDRLQIDRAVCCHLALLHGEPDVGLRESLQAYGESHGRLLLYTVFDPNRPDSLDRVRECLGRDGFVGIKIHPSFHGCYADDDRYAPVWNLAAERRVPILTHSWDFSEHNPTQKYSFPGRFERFVAEHPDVTLILGHAGGRYGGHVVAADLARRYPGIFLDLAGDCYTLGLVKHLVEHAGAEKVLFGSDLTWIDPRTQMGMILDARISIAAKRQILGVNAARIFAWETKTSTENSRMGETEPRKE
jgi:predicted TIM-barrel fold metal-dependent hydrolase